MKRYLSMASVAGLGAALMLGGSAVAQDQPIPVSAAIHAGSCAEPGEQVVALDAFRTGMGSAVGASGVPVVVESSTDDIGRISGQDLTGSPHLIAVFADDAMVACGDIGGVVDDDDLLVGLSPVDDSGYFGVANVEDITDDDDDDLEVDIYVVQPNS